MSPLQRSHASGGSSSSTSTYFFYVHGDHLGSSHIMTEGNPLGQVHTGITYGRGDLVQRYEYNPFGTEKYVLNSGLSTDPSFTGQSYDVDSGLYYYNSRYYNPDIGRFIQADTVIPDSTDIQAYNRYSYVRNNPLKYSDPSGHSWWKKVLGGLAIAIGIALAMYGVFGKADWLENNPMLRKLMFSFGAALAAVGTHLLGGQSDTVIVSYSFTGGGDVGGGRSYSNQGISQQSSPLSTKGLGSALAINISGFTYFSTGILGMAEVIGSEKTSDKNIWFHMIGLTGQWMLGIGAEKRVYSRNNVADAFRDANVTNQARQFWYEEVNAGRKSLYDGVTDYYGKKQFPRGNFGFYGAWLAGDDIVEQFAGSFTVDITSDGKKLTFTIHNPTSFESFFYGLGSEYSRETFKYGGNMNQVFIFEEPIKFQASQ